jgi:hypothetical protein
MLAQGGITAKLVPFLTDMGQITTAQWWLIAGGVLDLVVTGAVGAYVSDEKGRNGMEGFFFGVLFGPLGVIAAACMPTIPGKLKAADLPPKPSPLYQSREDYDDEQLRKAARQGRPLLGEVQEPKPRRPNVGE